MLPISFALFVVSSIRFPMDLGALDWDLASINIKIKSVLYSYNYYKYYYNSK